MNKLIIAGSRNYQDYTRLAQETALFMSEHGLHAGNTEIVSGGGIPIFLN